MAVNEQTFLFPVSTHHTVKNDTVTNPVTYVYLGSFLSCLGPEEKAKPI